MREFTKSDLKIGMVVETRGRDLYFFIGNNRLISGYMCNDFTEWNENLTYNINSLYKWDIIRVYKPNFDKIHGFKDILNKKYLELIWVHKDFEEEQQEPNKFENITDDELLEEIKRRFK